MWSGPIALRYRPQADGDADPGEIVWTWVPYEDDPSIGKDRPVVVIGLVEGARLAAVALSSKHHDGQRDWVALGAGPWDSQHRPSWVRVDRVYAVAPHLVRREGSALDRERFDRVVEALKTRHGW